MGARKDNLITIVRVGAPNDFARAKYQVYRPMVDLIGRSEGVDKGRVYNETLNCGA
ncbi:MAG TPA: hypothetical protein VGV39_13805 [Mesorhizobium sp.]|jgi:hypothetical protein|uniref:hypothetical protein n=1 Tax=Mesorhizobium sp. TaxID=1871066 RepID=UPI002DDD4F24|nr:hypothetical protein [Mesorhizobium sp.]HEV2504148.1 hypothetical protein [Mesorhizobium sp.]